MSGGSLNLGDDPADISDVPLSAFESAINHIYVEASHYISDVSLDFDTVLVFVRFVSLCCGIIYSNEMLIKQRLKQYKSGPLRVFIDRGCPDLKNKLVELKNKLAENRPGLWREVERELEKLVGKDISGNLTLSRFEKVCFQQ